MDYTIWAVAIAAVAFAYVLAYQWITNTIGNPKRVKAINENFRQIQKDLDKALKSKNNSEIEAVAKRQEQAMPTMLEMMWHMYKPLIAVIPLLALLSNPQFNFEERMLFPWPPDAAAIANISMANVTATMGLPPGTSMAIANSTQLQFNYGGQKIGELDKSSTPGYMIYTDYVDNYSFAARLANESGVEIAYFPSVRYRNPIAVQNAFKGFVITLPFSLPIIIQHLEKFPNWRDTFGAYGWFWICVVFGGLAVSIIKSINDKKEEEKAKAEGKAPTGGAPADKKP